MPGSYLEGLRGVFQGYKVLYRKGSKPYEELLVPPDRTEKDRQEIQLIDLSCYTNNTIQVVVFTLYGYGFPSDALTVLSGACGKRYSLYLYYRIA